MDIETIQKRVRAGYYLTKSHAIQHAVKEGFERKHIVEAILAGKIIEAYTAYIPDQAQWENPPFRRRRRRK